MDEHFSDSPELLVNSNGWKLGAHIRFLDKWQWFDEEDMNEVRGLYEKTKNTLANFPQNRPPHAMPETISSFGRVRRDRRVKDSSFNQLLQCD